MFDNLFAPSSHGPMAGGIVPVEPAGGGIFGGLMPGGIAGVMKAAEGLGGFLAESKAEIAAVRADIADLHGKLDQLIAILGVAKDVSDALGVANVAND